MNHGRLRSIHSIAVRGVALGRRYARRRPWYEHIRDVYIRRPYATAMRGIRVLNRLNEEHPNVVRRIFELRAEGEGLAAIAKRLNAEGASSPRPQQNRLAGWCSPSVREVTLRPLYESDVLYNQSRKRMGTGCTARSAAGGPPASPRPRSSHRVG
jgi:hypothetical protein